MSIGHLEAVWVDDTEGVAFATLVSLSGLDDAVVRGLVEAGALAPLDPAADNWRFERRSLAVARAAGRLHRAFALEADGLALAWGLLERIHDLESEVRSLQRLRSRD